MILGPGRIVWPARAAPDQKIGPDSDFCAELNIGTSRWHSRTYTVCEPDSIYLRFHEPKFPAELFYLRPVAVSAIFSALGSRLPIPARFRTILKYLPNEKI